MIRKRRIQGMDIEKAKAVCEHLPIIKSELADLHNQIANHMTKRDANLLMTAYRKLQDFQLAFETYNFKKFGTTIGEKHMSIIWSEPHKE